MEDEKRPTKKQRRSARQQVQPDKINFTLRQFDPLTTNQRLTYEAFHKGQHMMLHGIAGTGKSFISLYLAMEQIAQANSPYKKLVIVRSAVPTRDQGFVPGTAQEKNKVYEAPYQAIFTELFGRGDAYEYLKKKNLVEFITTSFIRGITLNDCIIVVDEIANCSLHELDSVITRIGKNCRVVFCGDFRQTDFTKEQEKNGLHRFMEIIKRMKSFTFIDFQRNDIVRSALVKEYIIQKDKLDIVS